MKHNFAKRLGALALALCLPAAALPGTAMAAQAPVAGQSASASRSTGAPALKLAAARKDGVTTVVATLKAGEGVTNGRFSLAYDSDAVTFESAEPGSRDWVSSVNSKTLGTVYFAWATSKLAAEDTVATFTFRDKTGASVSSAKYTAESMELYASGTAMEAAGDTVTVSYGGGAFVPGGSVSDEPEEEKPIFTDVTDHWAREPIEKLYEEGLVYGMGDGSIFQPETKVTRAMFVTVLYRSQDEKASGNASRFKDVKANAWYTAAVNWGDKAGVVAGITKETFAPSRSITREQLVAMLYRYAQKNGQDVSGRADLSAFSDADKVGRFTKDAMSWAVDKGIIVGSQGKLTPKSGATRAEMAAILCRFLGL